MVEICTIRIGRNGMDDDFTFYTNGKIKRYYDRNPFSVNNEDWVTPNEISKDKKQRILDNCPDECKSSVQTILLG